MINLVERKIGWKYYGIHEDSLRFSCIVWLGLVFFCKKAQNGLTSHVHHGVIFAINYSRFSGFWIVMTVSYWSSSKVKLLCKIILVIKKWPLWSLWVTLSHSLSAHGKITKKNLECMAKRLFCFDWRIHFVIHWLAVEIKRSTFPSQKWQTNPQWCVLAFSFTAIHFWLCQAIIFCGFEAKIHLLGGWGAPPPSWFF